MSYKFLGSSIVFTILLTGCSFKHNEKIVKVVDTNYKNTKLPFPSASLQKTLENKKTKSISLNDALYDFYYEWKGVKYKFGGNSKTGIDCSAFIQRAYKEKLNIKIPRTTLLQSKIGKQVSKSNLEFGDLVFFKTGKNSRHVGIYMQNGKFMHASTSKGVIISKLSNVYFNKHYWKAQRIIY